MKRRNRVSAMLLAGVTALSITACAGGGDTKGDGKTDPLAAAMANIETIKSMDAKMTMEMDMEADSEKLESITTMDMNLFNDPLRMKINMEISMGELGSANMEMYAEGNDSGTYTLYMYDGTDWYAQDATAEDLGEYNASDNMNFYMDNTTNFTQVGTEEIDGVSAYKYTGVITGEAMEEVMETSGALESLDSMELDESQFKELFSGLNDIDVTMWIDEENLYPICFEMDMTATMDSLMAKIVENMGEEAQGSSMSVPKMIITITCSNINNATDFTIPEEAKNA